MIVLERKTPESLLFYEVMKRRAIEPKEYEQLYATTWAGYFGERRLDREWKDAGINGLFFHDFTCFNLAGYKHQIDTIFVCKHFVLVVEAKNVAGRIELNSQTRQLIRYYDANSKEGEPFNSPVDQVKRHQQLLENHFLTLSDYVPVEAAVVITNRNCLIGNTGNEVPVFTVSGLRSVLTEMTRRHQHVSLNMKQIRTSLEKLYRPHTT